MASGPRLALACAGGISGVQAAASQADRAVRAARDARDGSAARPLAVGATPSLAAGLVPAAMRRLLDEAGPLPWQLVPGLTAELYERRSADPWHLLSAPAR